MIRFFLCLLLFSVKAFSCTGPGEGFLPPNHKQYPVHLTGTGLSEEEYHSVIDKFSRIYGPIVETYGAKLVIERKWESPTVNAGTLRRDEGKTWVVNLYGGFARHPDITPDGYMLVICHEIGHHIGGAPKKFYPETGSHWASTEGQSDYFATLKCLRNVLRNENSEDVIRGMEIPENIRTECRRSFKTHWEMALCLRTSMAGISVSKVNADIREVPRPDIDVVDNTVVESTKNEHPLPQCRLNTYYQGSICSVPSNISVSDVDEVQGTCHPQLEHTTGIRPACWFKPKE